MSTPFGLPLPVIYLEDTTQWRYLHHWHDFKDGPAPSEETLNAFGADGWELAAAFTRAKRLCYIFKRRS